ncbi:NAD-dependent epimerase/dehydratase family protein [Brachyspira pilosicoli]|uniref:NAD-dependent epimerase/dehydratase family protein n=1 Tax=Brachyspira pilosicoli TaxID=52584 RepID=UPI0012F51AD0|nr:NAD-dependent epimerase/dehydratase family protein [Brachyspira pilosicoli]
MNIILVGSTGYLGSQLLEKLHKENHNILCVTRNNRFFNTKNCVHINDDYFFDKLNLFNSDLFIYTACVYENNGVNYKDIFNTNFLFPLDLLNRVKTKTFLYIGTSLDKFTNQYSLSKHQFSEYGRYYSNMNDINFFNIKLESFYGKDEPNDRFMSNIINKLKNNEDINLTEGTQIRDFIYIDDVIDGIYKIIKSDLKGYYDIPLGSGEGISIKDLVIYLKETLNSKSKLNFGAIQLRKNEHRGVANLDIMKKLNFRIELDIKTSIKQHML